MLVVAEEDRDGRNTQPTRPTSQEGADPVDLTINIALDRLSGRRLPIDAIHAARPGRHGGNEKEPAADHDQGEPGCALDNLGNRTFAAGGALVLGEALESEKGLCA